MKSFSRITAALMLMTVTSGFALATALPSSADEPSCRTVIIGIGLGCTKDRSSPSPTPTETQVAPEAPVTPVPPATTPAPQTTVVITEAAPAPPPILAPEPVKTTQAAIIIPVPTATPSATEEAPSIKSEHASENNESPDLGEQAGKAAPYVFFVSLAVLVALLITARVRKLFPFEGKAKTTEK